MTPRGVARDDRVLAAYARSALFIAAGGMHFLFASGYVAIVPPWVPHPLVLVYVSGAAEVAGGASLLFPATRPAAVWGLLEVLAAVFPANIYMLQLARVSGAPSLTHWLLWLRLPIQPLLMWWMWDARGESGGPAPLRPD